MVIDFVPVEFYTPLYYHILLVVVLLTFLDCQIKPFLINSKTTKFSIGGFLLFWFVLLYMGLRPINGIFTDMTIYAFIYEQIVGGEAILDSKDFLFDYYMLLCSKVMTVENFFLTCAFVYVMPLYLVCKKWFGQSWFYAFLMLVVSFSFWAYGTNGIRNGMATSVFLLAISQEKRWQQFLWLLIATNLHASLQLPALGFIMTWVYNKSNFFFKFWLFSIPLSLVLPGFWESLFGSMVEDDRAAYFTDETYADSFSSFGFRWDFLFYSFTGVFAGWYYLFKKKYDNAVYLQLLNTFLFANAFWILVIRASFSNRFAYLSWFMLALVIVYPWLKKDFVMINKSKKLAVIILAYFSFTYIMNIILKMK